MQKIVITLDVRRWFFGACYCFLCVLPFYPATGRVSRGRNNFCIDTFFGTSFFISFSQKFFRLRTLDTHPSRDASSLPKGKLRERSKRIMAEMFAFYLGLNTAINIVTLAAVLIFIFSMLKLLKPLVSACIEEIKNDNNSED